MRIKLKTTTTMMMMNQLVLPIVIRVIHLFLYAAHPFLQFMQTTITIIIIIIIITTLGNKIAQQTGDERETAFFVSAFISLGAALQLRVTPRFFC